MPDVAVNHSMTYFDSLAFWEDIVKDSNLPRLEEDPPYFYRCHVFFCVNVRPDGHPRGCCSEKGSLELRAYMKGRAKDLGLTGVRINAAQCLDRCEFGPTMVIYPEGVWYRCGKKEDVDEILRVHLVGGGRVSQLLIAPDQGPISARN